MKQSQAIAAVILAAGASRRMGTPKALLLLNGETFLDRMIRLFAPLAQPVVVVLGHQAGEIRAGIKAANHAQLVVNPDPERGMLSSLQCGLAAIPSETEAVMFTPVDHPDLRQATLETLLRCYGSSRPLLAVPEHEGKHGHPVLIARPLIGELLALPPTAQAADVIHRHRADTIYVDVADPAVTTDIDDRPAYDELVARQSRREPFRL